jgi:dTMP kinase
MSTLARFVSLEGGEGAGKSTQPARLARSTLEAPGSTSRRDHARAGRQRGRRGDPPAARRGHASERWSPTRRAVPLSSRRARTTWSAWSARRLPSGRWVISDRFWDSTRVYQGLVGGLGLDAVDALHERWLAPFRPGLTLLLDVPRSAGLARAHPRPLRGQGQLAFHDGGSRRGSWTLAAREPARFRVVDASRDAPGLHAGGPCRCSTRIARRLHPMSGVTSVRHPRSTTPDLLGQEAARGGAAARLAERPHAPRLAAAQAATASARRRWPFAFARFVLAGGGRRPGPRRLDHPVVRQVAAGAHPDLVVVEPKRPRKDGRQVGPRRDRRRRGFAPPSERLHRMAVGERPRVGGRSGASAEQRTPPTRC